MSGTNFPEWLVTVSNQAAILGINLMVQSTVIIGIGILTAYAFKYKGAAVQSFILRAFLTVAFLSPLFIVAGRAPFPHRITFQVPQISPQRTKHFSSPVHRDLIDVQTQNSAQVKTGSDYPDKISQETEQSVSSTSAVIPHVSSGSTHRSFVTTETSRFSENAFAILYIFFFVGWAAVSLFLLLRMLAAHLYVLHIRRNAFPAKPHFREICLAAASEMHMTTPLIFQSSSVKIPFLTGLLRPAIFLPFGKAEVSLPCREICIHELSHLRRRDPLWNLLWHFGIVFLPFQPLMWILARGIEETSDYVCDDHVVQYTGEHHSYAVNLADLARVYHSPGLEAAAGVGFLSFKSSLRRRIGRILDNSRAIYLRVKMSFVVYVSSMCICAAFIAGLVGIRGKSFAQIRKIPETISKGALAAVISGAVAMKEQAEVAIEAVSHANKEDGEAKSEENTNQIIGTSDNESQGENEISSMPPENKNAINVNETSGTFGLQNVASLISDTTLVHSEAETGIGASVTEKTSKGEKSPAGNLPEKFSSKKENAQSTQYFSDLRELTSAVTDKVETVIARTGPMEISIPGGLPSGLRESLESGQQNPVWSPSGKVIAFTGSNGIGLWAVSVKGGKPVLVLDNSNDPLSKEIVLTRGYSRILCFTPDGSEITCLKFVPKTDGAAKSVSVAVSLSPVIENINLSTGSRRVIVENASDGSWSPDGRYFVYVGGDYYGISVLDTKTGDGRKVSGTGMSPCLTPDGSSIIYVDWSWDATNQLFRAPLTGGKPVQLTGEGFWWNPKCSPDGEWVLCSYGDLMMVGSYTYLQAYNLSSHKVYAVFMNSAETAEVGSWSPSGRQFCYTLSGGVYTGGMNIRKSAIYIGDFPLSNVSKSAAVDQEKPFEFKLIGNYPNPFNPSTTIKFSLPKEGLAELVIFNSYGQKIRELVSRSMPSGMHSVVWDGRDQQGNPVSSGIYISRLKMEGKVESSRMTLVK